MCGIWSWSGWCEGLFGGVRKWVVCGLCAGLGLDGVWDLEWLVCGIWSWSGWCEGFLGGVRGWE